jgi:hypothetical protein
LRLRRRGDRVGRATLDGAGLLQVILDAAHGDAKLISELGKR